MWMMFGSQAIIGVIIAFVYSWKLTLVLIAISPLMGIGSVLQMRILAQGAQSQASAFERATNLAIEVISGFSTVASFGWMPQAEEKFTKLIAETHKPRIRAAHLAGLAWGGDALPCLCLFPVLFAASLFLLHVCRVFAGLLVRGAARGSGHPASQRDYSRNQPNVSARHGVAGRTGRRRHAHCLFLSVRRFLFFLLFLLNFFLEESWAQWGWAKCLA